MNTGSVVILISLPFLGSLPLYSAGLGAGNCALPQELQGVRGHVLFELRPGTGDEPPHAPLLYASISPEDRKDEFIAALRHCLRAEAGAESGWGDLQDGEPRLVSLHYFQPAPRGTPQVPRADGTLFPLTWVKEMRDEKIRLAEVLMSGTPDGEGPGRRFTEIIGNGWVLKTDLEHPDDLNALKDGLRFAVRAFYAAFPDAPLPSGRGLLTVIFFQYPEALRRMEAFDTLISDPTGVAGEYNSLDRTIVAVRGDRPRHVMARLMAHEVAHHFIAHSIGRTGRRFPIWINEGTAAFIECLRPPEGGVLDLAGVDRGTVLKGDTEWPLPAERYFEALASAGGESRMPALSDFLSRSYERSFYDHDPAVAYGTAWFLVHYLLNGDGKKHRGAFRIWVQESTVRSARSLEQAIGMPVEDLEKNLKTYIEKLNRNP